MNKILIILGIILISVVLCFIKDFVEKRYGIEKASEIMVFIIVFPFVISLLYWALQIMGV